LRNRSCKIGYAGPHKKVLLVPEVHLLNWPLYLFLSIFFRIIACKIEKRIFPFAGKRIELLRLEDYFDWEECALIISDTVSYWEKNIRPDFPKAAWDVNVADVNLDLSRKAMQDLGKEVEKILVLGKVADYFDKKESGVYLIRSLKFRYLLGIDKNIQEDAEKYSASLLSFINVQLDRLYMCVENGAYTGILLLQLLYGLLLYGHRELAAGEIKYIWDGISPRELSTDPGKVFFPWIIDGKSITKKQVLFLLPRPDFQMKRFSMEKTKAEGYRVSNQFEMIRYASGIATGLCLMEALKLVFKNIFAFNLSIEALLTSRYSVRILKWLPIIDYLKPRAYITSGSGVSNEEPAVLYMQKKGIKTIAWYYGTNSYLFVSGNRTCNFRNVIFCSMLSEAHLVWNTHYKKFIESHAQGIHEIIVSGPLMAGDEEVINLEKNLLLEKIGFPDDVILNGKQRYISVFDAPPVAKKFKRPEVKFLDSNTEEYNYSFIRDMLKLLDEFEDICLIYKPKRSITSGKFNYSPELKRIFERLLKNPRAVILDYNINPWIPIAVADMCISMPFESPAIATIHYGKPAIFHDPCNIALHHRYNAFPEIMTHNYSELESKISRWFLSKENGLFIQEQSSLSELTGIYPKTNSTERLREYLSSIS